MQAASLDVRSLSVLFKALSDESRLRIVALLAHGELCVCHIESALELPQPTVSRHLGVLRSAGVVEARREGTWMHYRLARQLDAACTAQLHALVDGFAKHDMLRRDVERLRQVKTPGACK